MTNGHLKLVHEALTWADSNGLYRCVQTLGPSQSDDPLCQFDLRRAEPRQVRKAPLLQRIVEREGGNARLVLRLSGESGVIGLEIGDFRPVKMKPLSARLDGEHVERRVLELL